MNTLTSPLTLRFSGDSIYFGDKLLGKFTTGTTEKGKVLVKSVKIDIAAFASAFEDKYVAALLAGAQSYAVKASNNNASDPVAKLLSIIGSGFGLLDVPTAKEILEAKNALRAEFAKLKDLKEDRKSVV